MILASDADLRALLASTRTVAIVGASPDPRRPSHGVWSYLRAQPGLCVCAINPTVETVDGVRAYVSLRDCARDNGVPDIVDVFRKPADAERVARNAIAAGARAIWFQLGVVGDAAIRLADAAGLLVVVDRCLKIEHRRLGTPAQPLRVE